MGSAGLVLFIWEEYQGAIAAAEVWGGEGMRPQEGSQMWRCLEMYQPSMERPVSHSRGPEKPLLPIQSHLMGEP